MHYTTKHYTDTTDIDVSRCSAQWCHLKEPMCKSIALFLDFKNPA